MRQSAGQDRKGDAASLRKIITSEIKRSNLSREEIAAKMSEMLGVPITARMISSFTAESKELHRWPGEFDIALCEVLGSYRLLSERVKRAGFRMVGPNEERLMAIGKAWEQMTRAKRKLVGA